MADFTEARLKALGARTERRKAINGAGADIVIGTFDGGGSRKLMLMAHSPIGGRSEAACMDASRRVSL